MAVDAKILWFFLFFYMFIFSRAQWFHRYYFHSKATFFKKLLSQGNIFFSPPLCYLCHIHIVYQQAREPPPWAKQLTSSESVHSERGKAQMSHKTSKLVFDRVKLIWERVHISVRVFKSHVSWAVLPSRHHCVGYFFPRLTQLLNLNSISLWTSPFEIQLCWQSCIRLRLQCTSTLSHVAAHQQSVSLRCYTFFWSLPSYTRCIMNQKVNRKIKLCHNISNRAS